MSCNLSFLCDTALQYPPPFRSTMSAEGTLLADPTSCNYMYVLVFMPVMPLEGRVGQWISVCIADL